MTNELNKWFDAMTTTCLNVNPRILDGVNVGLAKSQLLSSATITEPTITERVTARLLAGSPDASADDAPSDKPLRQQTPRPVSKTEDLTGT